MNLQILVESITVNEKSNGNKKSIQNLWQFLDLQMI